jgi:hypothetical protein
MSEETLNASGSLWTVEMRNLGCGCRGVSQGTRRLFVQVGYFGGKFKWVLGSKIWTLVWPKIRPGIGLGSGSSSVLSFCHNLSSGSCYRTSSPCRTSIITQAIACSAVQCLGPGPPSHVEGELCHSYFVSIVLSINSSPIHSAFMFKNHHHRFLQKKSD